MRRSTDLCTMSAGKRNASRTDRRDARRPDRRRRSASRPIAAVIDRVPRRSTKANSVESSPAGEPSCAKTATTSNDSDQCASCAGKRNRSRTDWSSRNVRGNSGEEVEQVEDRLNAGGLVGAQEIGLRQLGEHRHDSGVRSDGVRVRYKER